MFKKVIRLFINDSPLRGIRLRDNRLSAVPVGKVMVAGTLWTGALRPLIDAIAATFGPSLDTPLRSGRTLHANELSGVIDLGRAWVGNLTAEIRSATANTSAGPTVDVGEVLNETERLDLLLRSAAPGNAIADGLARLRRAADRVGGARTRDAVNPLTQLAQITPEQRQSGPNSPDNVRGRDFWRQQAAPTTSRPIGDNTAALTTVVRDQLAIAARAKDMRTRMEALNRAASAFWARA